MYASVVWVARAANGTASSFVSTSASSARPLVASVSTFSTRSRTVTTVDSVARLRYHVGNASLSAITLCRYADSVGVLGLATLNVWFAASCAVQLVTSATPSVPVHCVSAPSPSSFAPRTVCTFTLRL